MSRIIKICIYFCAEKTVPKKNRQHLFCYNSPSFEACGIENAFLLERALSLFRNTTEFEGLFANS